MTLIEKITNESIVYRRVTKKAISKNNEITENLFTLRVKKCEKDLSVIRNKYCDNPEKARCKKVNNPNDFCVISLCVFDIRNKCELDVLHTPSGSWYNRDMSHSSIIPPKNLYQKIINEGQIKLIYRQSLANCAKWEIKP